MKVAVEEKLRRIMLIRSNKQEANAAAHNGTSNHRKCYNKIHLDGPLISETKLIMTPSIDTEQNMTISIQMRIEIVEIFKFGTLTVRIDKL